MILSSVEIARQLEVCGDTTSNDGLYIAPRPDIAKLRASAAASVDLRLGTWFVTTKLSRHSELDVHPTSENARQPSEHNLTTRHYVPFGKTFILHPRSFVLASTLEWLRMPKALCGYV